MALDQCLAQTFAQQAKVGGEVLALKMAGVVQKGSLSHRPTLITKSIVFWKI